PEVGGACSTDADCSSVNATCSDNAVCSCHGDTHVFIIGGKRTCRQSYVLGDVCYSSTSGYFDNNTETCEPLYSFCYLSNADNTYRCRCSHLYFDDNGYEKGGNCIETISIGGECHFLSNGDNRATCRQNSECLFNPWSSTGYTCQCPE
ncbi:hypothetical protein MAR_010969, partial [Mya arenaria]